jgi:hypothetical protein
VRVGAPSRACALSSGVRSISAMGSIDDAFKGLWADISDSMHEQYAQATADAARENGLASADSIEITVESDSTDPRTAIDIDRVRRRANQILASGS